MTHVSRIQWVVVADARRARLLQCTFASAGSASVRPCATLVDDWPGHEHHRPSPLAAKDGRAYASLHHDAEEQLRRFGRRIVGWIGAAAADRGIERLTLFAPPRLLGVFRGERLQDRGPEVDLREGELAHMTEADLCRHPAIEGLAAATASPRD